jgi:hypothetical protein
VGGRGGQAFSQNGGAPTFNGVKSEATLRSESRIKGDTEFTAVSLGVFAITEDSVFASSTHGWRFNNNGNLLEINSDKGNTTFTTSWTQRTLTDVGDNYEIRQRGLAGDDGFTWDASPGAAGTWFSLSLNREWTITQANPNFDKALSLIEIRRTDLPAGSSDDEITDSIFITAKDEAGV